MKIITTNKKAYFDYKIIQVMEAGIVLSGPEVKSIKNGRVNLAGGYVNINSNYVPRLINVHVDPYPPAAAIQKNYNPTQTRKLLLHHKEISSLIGKLKTKGLSLVPLKIYVEHSIIKVQIGLVKGKKKWDKRESIKKREIKRKIEQSLKN